MTSEPRSTPTCTSLTISVCDEPSKTYSFEELIRIGLLLRAVRHTVASAEIVIRVSRDQAVRVFADWSSVNEGEFVTRMIYEPGKDLVESQKAVLPLRAAA